jgi:N-acetylmuramoyl-L-alanine amidase
MVWLRGVLGSMAMWQGLDVTPARRVATITVALVLAPVAAPCGGAADVATVRAVRQITTPATTRLIVELSAPVHYRLERAAPRPDLGIPARLYVDFEGARLENASVVPTGFAEGPLLRLRASRREATTLRLILDVPGLTAFDAFPMTDPFRLIVDVQGTPRAAPPPAVAAPAPTPPPAPVNPTTVPRVGAMAATRRERPAPTPGVAAPRRVKIVIDPGHGGKDPGALGPGGIAEKDVVLAIALRLRDRLAAVPDTDVVLTRDRDVFVPLEARTARANAERADLFVSIHGNASPNPELSGVETYYLNNTNDRATLRLAAMENGLRSMTGHDNRDRDASLILSDLIQTYKIQESVLLAEALHHGIGAALVAHGTPAADLGVKRGPFYVLVGAGMPCALAEVSFLTHPREGERLAQPAYQESIAEGLLRGIERFVENSRAAENL